MVNQSISQSVSRGFVVLSYLLATTCAVVMGIHWKIVFV